MKKKAPWRSKRKTWDWRKFLSEKEAAFIAAADLSISELEKLRKDFNRIYAKKRQIIVNRAIQRARYAARK